MTHGNPGRSKPVRTWVRLRPVLTVLTRGRVWCQLGQKSVFWRSQKSQETPQEIIEHSWHSRPRLRAPCASHDSLVAAAFVPLQYTRFLGSQGSALLKATPQQVLQVDSDLGLANSSSCSQAMLCIRIT